MAVAALRDSELIDTSGQPLTTDPAAPIRMTAVDEHRRHAENCLRQMADYAESATCRRATILRYFGETPPDRCTGCDNCQEGAEQRTVTVDEGLLEAILQVRAELAEQYSRDPQDMFPARTAQELATYRPRSSEELLQVHGIGRTRSRWFGDELLAAIAQWEREHPEAAARPDIFDDSGRRRVARPRRGEDGHAQVSESDPVLQRLKVWRRDLAEQQGVPAFTILWDRTLRALAARRPKDLTQLRQVWGMGEARVARFGAELLSVIRGNV